MPRAYSDDEPEWMDLPSPDEQMIREDLANLERMNRHFAGHQQVIDLFELLSKDRRELTLLDVATGYGDHPRRLVQWAVETKRIVDIVAVDFQRRTLELASEATAPDLPVAFIQADARHLPFKDQSVDITFSTLALHHFSDDDAEIVLREKYRVSNIACAVLDLVRSMFSVAALWLLTTLVMRAPMTRHDGWLSIRRSFTGKELKSVAKKAGWIIFRHRHLSWFRHVISCQKNGPS